MYRHVIWDLGGTLVNTYPQLAGAFVDVAAGHGHQVDADEVTRLTRVSTRSAIEELSRRFGVPESEFVDAHERLKTEWRTTPAPAMPGAAGLMTDLGAAGGLNLVVTHRERASATALLNALHLPADDLITPDDGFPRKPHPAMHLAMIARHRLVPSECLGVGDRPIDVDAAHRAGIAAATLLPAAINDGADHHVSALHDLRPLLELCP